MSKFKLVARAKLRKKAQAAREAKDSKRPRQLPWKKSRDGASQVLNNRVTEKVTFKEYLINEATYHNTPEYPIYLYKDGAVPVELLDWNEDTHVVVIRDYETKETHHIPAEEFKQKYRKAIKGWEKLK